MTVHVLHWPARSFRRVAATVAYYAQLVALQLFGPPQLDDEQDPIVQLRRRYGRGR